MQQQQPHSSPLGQDPRQYAIGTYPTGQAVDNRLFSSYRPRGGGVGGPPVIPSNNQIHNMQPQPLQSQSYNYNAQSNSQISYTHTQQRQPPLGYPNGSGNSQSMFGDIAQGGQPAFNLSTGTIPNHQIPSAQSRPARGAARPLPQRGQRSSIPNIITSNPAGQQESTSNKRTRVETVEDEEGDEEWDEEADGAEGTEKPQRGPGACSACKQLKIRCVFPSKDAPACKGCIRRNRECTIPEKRPRRAPPKREELVKVIRDKDALIFQLIEQLEARSSSLTMNLSLTAGDSPTNVRDTGKPTDPLARDAIEKEHEQREKELREWIKKVKATIERTDAMEFGLLGGVGNVVLSDGEEDCWDGSSETENDEISGGEVESAEEINSPQNGSRRSIKRGASLVSSQSKKSGSANSGDAKSKGSALPAKAPLGLIEHMGRSLNRRRSTGKSRGSSPLVPGSDDPSHPNLPKIQSPVNDEDKELGVSNPEFFLPIERPYNVINGDKLDLPTILSKSIIGPKEVKELFDMYFEYINLSTCLLDPVLYTPEKTLYRSPFLFTVVCAIASRFHPSRASLYPVLMSHARLAAGSAIISGRKSLETCQAYILMSFYPIPARRWSEDRSWMYLGCAIRMATDLNLHHPPVLESGEPAVTIATIMKEEGQSREILNRTRCWLGCFNADKAMSTQFGKPTTLREDWMFPLLQRNMSEAEGNAEWWCPTPFGSKFDIHLCAYSALLREISDFHEQIYSDPTNPTGINENIAFEEVTYDFDNRIESMAKQWFTRVDGNMDREDPQCVFRKGLLQLEFYYNQLVALSFGFQHAFKRGAIQRDNTFLQRCYHAACRVVRIVVEELGEQKYMRYCPESHYIFATFASAFLLKLLRPKFSPLLEVQQHHDILDLVERLATTLNRIAMDANHAPKLYSRFLMGLLKKAHKILAKGSNASTASSPASTVNLNSASSPATQLREFPSSGLSKSYLPDTTTLANPGSSYDHYAMGIGISQQMQAPSAQGTYGFGAEGTAFDVDGMQSTLPQGASWPHGTMNAGADGDTLMHMEMFNPQFWEEGLLPGFTWTDSTVMHHGENVVRDYSNIPAGEIPTFGSVGGGFVPAGEYVTPVTGQSYQQNPIQVFPVVPNSIPHNHQHQHQQQPSQNPYIGHSTWGSGV